MKPNNKSIRAFGQRSLASFCSPNFPKDSEEEDEKKHSKSSKGSCISLSAFLDRKLQKTSAPPGTVQGKQKPFSSPVDPKYVTSMPINEQTAVRKGGEAEPKPVLDKVVFEQFKHTDVESGDRVKLDSSNIGEVGSSNADDLQDSRKRKNPFEGWDTKHTTRKNLVVLGGDPKPENKRRRVTSIRKKEPVPIYNHYANGSGWWDNDMEGIDSEEVGSTEVWEGVGSTTFEGVIDWH